MKIYRKRYIPNEIIDISKDKVEHVNDELLVTSWLPIHPRNDVAFGISYAYLKKGWKISKFYDKDKNFLYWYCDIIDAKIKDEEYTLIDLLVDVKVYPDGKYEILDEEELDEALKQKLITKEQKEEALNKLNALLEIIKHGEFPPKECKELEI